MQTIYPNLTIGNHADMHFALYVQSTYVAVLDLSSELSTRKWNRNKLTLRKVGLAKNKALAPSKIKKALEFIQDQRSQNHAVLVGCEDGMKAKLIVLAYLVVNKDFTTEAALAAVGDVEIGPALDSVVGYAEKHKEAKVCVGG